MLFMGFTTLLQDRLPAKPKYKVRSGGVDGFHEG